MKLLPAKYVIEKALHEKRIKKNDVVVETSSGTYALGLAIVCAEHEIPFHIVSDNVIDQDLRQQLEHLGGKVEIVEDRNSPQIARLKAVKDYLARYPSSFWPQQYDNSEHLSAYFPFADFLIKNFGNEFTLVASVGSGSSSCGTISHLRRYNRGITLVGVDTFGSVLFGLENNKRMLRGLGNSLMPKNLDHSLFDQVHWVSAANAFLYTRDLYARSALFAGATSGACYQVAQWIADRNPKEKIVFISADSGNRYSSTVYNNEWMEAKGFAQEIKIRHPVKVNSLSELKNSSMGWGYMDWNRLPLQQVLNA